MQILKTFHGNSGFIEKLNGLFKICTLFHINWLNNYKSIHSTTQSGPFDSTLYLFNPYAQTIKDAELTKFGSSYIFLVNLKRCLLNRNYLSLGREKE